MRFPKDYMQERTNFRVHENERSVHNFLRNFFKKIFVYTVSSTAFYLLFGREEPIGTDDFQFDGSLQISKQSNVKYPKLNLVAARDTTGNPVALLSGDTLGAIEGSGYFGSGYYVGGRIVIYAGEDWTNANRGTGLAFFTTSIADTSEHPSGRIAPSGSWAIGLNDLPTNATSGFAYIPSCNGVPTGTPEVIDERIPLVIDRNSSKAYIYSGGAWVALN